MHHTPSHLFLPQVPEIDVANAEYPIATFEKKLFSMITEEVKAKIAETPERKTFVLFGIEAHVCVQQTALDLLEQGYAVHVLVDGVSSQRAHDRAVALRRMEKAGAYLTTAESLVFMLLGGASHPQFRTIATLIKEHAAGATSPFEELVKTNAAL
jgi:nicotinamidase-related amidase